jgi:hypothetical protein
MKSYCQLLLIVIESFFIAIALYVNFFRIFLKNLDFFLQLPRGVSQAKLDSLVEHI